MIPGTPQPGHQLPPFIDAVTQALERCFMVLVRRVLGQCFLDDLQSKFGLLVQQLSQLRHELQQRCGLACVGMS